MKYSKAAFQAIILLFFSFALVGCGGGSGDSSPSTSDTASDLNGTWRSSKCDFDGQVGSITEEISFSGNNFTASNITYLDNVLCSSDLTSTLHIDGTFSLPTGSAPTSNAAPIDLTFLNGRQTASDATIELLASQGTTLADAFAAQGIADINNIPVSTILPNSQHYTIFAQTGNTLTLGDESPSFDGSTPELRHITLGTDVYTLVDSESIDANSPTIPQVIGVAFDQGELENSFDFVTGLVITNLVGGGAYMVLENSVVIQTSTAPDDFDFENFFTANPRPMVLAQLGIREDEIFPPLEPGFTFDFRGEFNTPGMGGPTFRNIQFTSDGLFEQNNRNLLSAPAILDINVLVSSSSNSGGTYEISGNSIELRFGNGTVERLLFATDGSRTVIIGQQRYLAP